ncbi:hypothetical protein A3D05_04870 [Candidatus Gottesmanbacteria bacterium RIFCSPHIGHO2_02_FULL_40_24]|uniref:Glycosyltransferase 2-like domain-containing protein n=1 Tax=Candidatus Gottesmanbacteria bacterium RIFCSPHIGHO2_01_FULL_40_15 TaxID=1798376 RepID=A0A1F5Z2C8_9BACT|nr:MAG: hypothetical protein A2777_05900 [Candidatus Gottesmanbacteria bacterium RIFCSPHIGHO2_01_FULL_40_15]OGG16203.1 MAG: hypothetical protein A3D05_04870 [Candidatus Gottesmanbacteria bacterium RIFCSPHIGHO2_02_FULL_40_24]OGG25871.1 MAG: hypothetical protein A3E42_06145 [Candidatus Gottesmanbacteria bacterium RIFCSPHIGHO2_12_FULL_40_13]
MVKRYLLDVIIVSFNTATLLRQALQSVQTEVVENNIKEGTRITVIDNASTDGTSQMVRKNFPGVSLIVNNKNTGFAKANNQAIRKTSGKYILLLNSDAIVGKKAINALINELEINSKAGGSGPRLVNFDGGNQPSFGFFPTPWRVLFWMLFIDDIKFISDFFKPYHARHDFFYRRRRTVDWLSGACILVRREAFEKAGLFDESIFMYGEEVEFFYRMKKSGFEAIFTPNAIVRHKKGGSGRGTESGIVEEYLFIVHFYRIYFPGLVVPVRFLLKLGALLRMILFAIIGPTKKVSLYAKAFKVA